MNKFRLKIRLILWSILCLAVFIFVYLVLVPAGHIVYINNFSKNIWHAQNFIERFTPSERVENGNGFIKISGDPVYFSLFTPRKFERASVSIKYQNLNEVKNPILELGLLMNKTVWSYKLEPLQNKLFENFANDWYKIENNGLVFLQREKKYDSLNDFLASNPKREELALYNYDLKNKFELQDYRANNNWQTYPELRGAYQFYVYIKDEDLNLKLETERLENLPAKDEIILLVSDWNDKEIFRQNISSSNKIDLNLKNLVTGTYKVEVRTGDNILTKNFSTTQSKLVFINRVWSMAPIEFWGDNNHLKVRTVAPGSLGNMYFGLEKFDINKTYEPFNFVLNNFQDLNYIRVVNPDLIVESNGLFAFSKEQYFNPAFKRFGVDLAMDKINYLLGEYKMPASAGDDKVATVDFEISNAYREFGKNSFMISIPGADATQTTVLIKEIKVELWGRTIWEKIKEIL